jgi:hypothetical protein
LSESKGEEEKKEEGELVPVGVPGFQYFQGMKGWR